MKLSDITHLKEPTTEQDVKDLMCIFFSQGCALVGDDFYYTVNNDLSVSANTAIHNMQSRINKILPFYKKTQYDHLLIEFRNIDDLFRVESVHYKSMKNCPLFVGGNFQWVGTHIKNLEFIPKHIGGTISLHGNELLETISGCQREVSGDFVISGCFNLKSLKGGPKEVTGDYSATMLPNLDSLDGVATFIGGNLNIPKHLQNNFEKIQHKITVLGSVEFY